MNGIVLTPVPQSLSDELRTLKAPHPSHSTSNSRSSIDSTRSRARPFSPGGAVHEAIDYVYLKNVLLQFLEQRDKKYQQQLIPVLGMLLKFDKGDEQKWMAALSAK
jgi:hypothetical protein